MPAHPFAGLTVDHVEFYVADLQAATRYFVDGYGFAVHGMSDTSNPQADTASVALGSHQIRIILTTPLRDDHPGAAYLENHGDGVADIAMRVDDVAACFAETVRRGGRPVSPPTRHGGTVLATVGGFGDVVHTLVQRDPGADERVLPWLAPVVPSAAERGPGLLAMDHFAICLESGQLEPTVDFYRETLDFDMIFTEHIVVGAQAMNSKVVQSRTGAITFTLIEPDVSRTPGQIDDFIKHHGGAGVQHIAFNTDDIVSAVAAMGARGVEFLRTPAAYYRLLRERITPVRHSTGDLQERNILLDEDHHGQLFQIFTRSAHPRNTLFMEIIERVGAQTFGSRNIQALYEAVELQRAETGTS
ncbi:4-hydroxyphenylpyruvate dioxygenase [Catellatospora methionotrophica]|uniref:4-hydroxyphenylpyruvate dioxygenase n=1 Tax=Catellatospora methionotrophica TaxID=121620 RepID=UPI0033E6DC74